MSATNCLAACGIAVLLQFPLLPATAKSDSAISVLGPGKGSTREYAPCQGNLWIGGDESWERAVAWELQGVVPPDYGAFAEGFDTGLAPTFLYDLRFYLTTVSPPPPVHTLDVYIYDDVGDNPGSVLSSVIGIDPGPIALWPQVSEHVVPAAACIDEMSFFIGGWGDWPMEGPGWWFAADGVGSIQGRPRTHVAPGIGYPTGWQDPSSIFGNIRAMGIGICYGDACPPAVPARLTSWGRIKELYHSCEN